MSYEDREEFFNAVVQRKPSFRFMDEKAKQTIQLTLVIPKFVGKFLNNVDQVKQKL